MLGLLLGGLIGRAAMGRAAMGAAVARPLARRAASPVLGGLLRRQAAPASGGRIGGGGKATAQPAQQATTIKQEQPQPEQPQQIAKEVSPPAQEPMVSQTADALKQETQKQEAAQQAAQQASQQPVRPLEGLIDDKPQATQPRQAPGTTVPEPPLAINQGEGMQTTVAQQGQQLGGTPEIEQPFQADKIRELPPRTTFEAPEGFPSPQISTDTKVSNSSPGYMSLGMTVPSYQFSYSRR